MASTTLDSTAQERQATFLANVRQALGVAERTRLQRLEAFFAPDHSEADPLVEKQTDTADGDLKAELVKRLGQNLQPVNHHMLSVADQTAAAQAIVTLAEAKRPEWGGPKQIVAWEAPLIEAMDLHSRLAPLDIALKLTRTNTTMADALAPEAYKSYCAQAFIGVTTADHCVADCATLAMQTRAGQPRMVSLLPSIHIAVIRAEQLVSDLKALYQKLAAAQRSGQDSLANSTTFISGPSKTADIELCMVAGAHGPREVHIIVID